MKVYERMRQYMDMNGIMLKIIAKKANMSTGRFYRLMSGESPLLVDEYEVICRDGLSIDPGYFFKQKFLETKNGAES